MVAILRRRIKIIYTHNFVYGKKLLQFFVFILFLPFLFSQCTYSTNVNQVRKGPLQAANPKYHIIKKGETLWRISKLYNVPLGDLIQYNNITDVTNIPVGTKIYFYRKKGSRREIIPSFQWPLKGEVSNEFEMKGMVQHAGIDILADEGTPVFAAASGEVVYSGNEMAGYGNILILKHSSGFSTVYAHNKENLEKVGNVIVKGGLIARVGNTGRSTSPHLHFEIRKNEKPVDPIQYLPVL